LTLRRWLIGADDCFRCLPPLILPRSVCPPFFRHAFLGSLLLGVLAKEVSSGNGVYSQGFCLSFTPTSSSLFSFVFLVVLVGGR